MEQGARFASSPEKRGQTSRLSPHCQGLNSVLSFFFTATPVICHVVRQAVLVGRVVLALDQRLAGSRGTSAVMPKPSSVM